MTIKKNLYKVFITMEVIAFSEQDAMERAVDEMVEAGEVQGAELKK